MDDSWELFDYWTLDIETKFLTFKQSKKILERINNMTRKDMGNGEIMIVKRISDTNNHFIGIEKTARNSKQRVKEWNDRILLRSIKVECIDLIEKLLHILFDEYRITRKNQKDGHNEIEWFDFKKENEFHKFIDNVKMIKKMAVFLDDKSKLNIKNVQKVNIKTATMDELLSLAGIGKTLAERIIKYQNTYQTIEDLKKLKGIGDGVFGKIERFVCV